MRLAVCRVELPADPGTSKNPLRHEVEAEERLTGDLTSHDDGRPNRPIELGSAVMVSSKYFSPKSSAVSRIDCRVGTATPTP